MNQLKLKKLYIFIIACFMASAMHAQVILKANGGNEDAYQHISQVLGGTAYEVPDCIHPVQHITEDYDSELKAWVFVFHIHATLDNDRCKSFDRQRNEIKTYGPSEKKVKGELGKTVVYQWKFKLDSNFKAQPTFTHIHQIKAGDGDAGAPLITLTPRYGTPDMMEIIHTGASKQSSKGVLTSVPLADFKGAWVQVTEKVKYDTHGTYNIEVKRISDNKVLLSFATTDIDLWRTGTTFCRPKWGIYRSLKSPSYIRDEDLRFADFSIEPLD